MAVVPNNTLLPGDPRLIDHIVCELKSQGIFDQFRKECISDVDTKPAYQNLRQRVEGSVSGFLKDQLWKPDMNKNQLREALRKNIYESGFLETGVERIVDQVVNPKINAVFLPQVEEVVYKFLGLEKPTKIKNTNGPLSINTIDLLPTDLDPISPDTEILDKTMIKKDKNVDLDESKIDEDESPPFESIIEKNIIDENSNDSKISGISGLTSHDSNLSDKDLKIDTINPDSQLSKVSSNSQLSIITSDSKNIPEKMDISDDSKSNSSEIFSFEKLSQNGFGNIQQEIKDELAAIQNEINNPKPVIDRIFDQKPDIPDDKMDTVDNKPDENQDIINILKNDDSKPDQQPEPAEKVDEIKPEIVDIKPDETLTKVDQITTEPQIDQKSNEPKIDQKPNEPKVDQKPTEPKVDQKPDEIKDDKKIESKEKNERHRSDSERRREKDKKSDKERDRKHSSSKSSTKDKDRYRDKSKDTKSKDKDKKDDNKDKKESKKDDKRSSSSSKHSSRDRSKSDSKNDSKSDSKNDSKSESKSESKSDSKSESKSSSKDYKKDKKDDSRSKSDKSESKSSKSDSKSSSSRSRDHSKSESKSKDRKSSSNRDHRDKKESKTSKDSKKSKDDHNSSKDKKDNRRSADRDSNDGSAGPNTSTHKETKDSHSSSSKNENDSTPNSNSENSGQSDNSQGSQPVEKSPKIVDLTDKSPELLLTTTNEIKIKKPKFASNIFEARKLMKIRKKIERMERKRQKKLELSQMGKNLDSPNINSPILDSLEDTDSVDSAKLLLNENIEKTEVNKEESNKTNAVVSKANWDAIESKLGATVNQNVDFDSYIDENNDSSNSLEPNESKSSKRASEDEDCLYFNNQVSPTTQRFLKSVETYQKTSKVPEEKSKMAPPNKRVKKNNEEPKKTIAKRKQTKGKKRKINEDDILDNNNKKINNSFNVVELAEEYDDLQPSPSASNTSNGSIETKKTRKKKKNSDYPLPLSPDSDISGGKPEPTPVVKNRAPSSKTQRYSSDDLYKPRPFVSGTSRRQRRLLNNADTK